MSYITIPFSRKIGRKLFDCKESSLNRYIQQQVSQDIKKKLAVCFVLPDETEDNIIGYYTLSNASINYNEIPEELRKKYPSSYEQIPVTLMGRLAVDAKHQGRKLGAALLLDAFVRCFQAASTSIASVAVVVDPIDEKAERFYEHFGFIKIPDTGRMFISMKTIKSLITEHLQ